MRGASAPAIANSDAMFLLFLFQTLPDRARHATALPATSFVLFYDAGRQGGRTATFVHAWHGVPLESAVTPWRGRARTGERETGERRFHVPLRGIAAILNMHQRFGGRGDEMESNYHPRWVVFIMLVLRARALERNLGRVDPRIPRRGLKRLKLCLQDFIIIRFCRI